MSGISVKQWQINEYCYLNVVPDLAALLESGNESGAVTNWQWLSNPAWGEDLLSAVTPPSHLQIHFPRNEDLHPYYFTCTCYFQSVVQKHYFVWKQVKDFSQLPWSGVTCARQCHLSGRENITVNNQRIWVVNHAQFSYLEIELQCVWYVFELTGNHFLSTWLTFGSSGASQCHLLHYFYLERKYCVIQILFFPPPLSFWWLITYLFLVFLNC